MERYLGNVILTRHGNSVLLDTYTQEQIEEIKQRMMDDIVDLLDTKIEPDYIQSMYPSSLK